MMKVGKGPFKDLIVKYHIMDKNALGDTFNHTESFSLIRMVYSVVEICLHISQYLLIHMINRIPDTIYVFPV